MGNEVDDDRAMASARWSSVVRFTVADLELNARGRLSRRQRLRCARTCAGQLAIALAFLATAIADARTPPYTGGHPMSPTSMVIGSLVVLAASMFIACLGVESLQDAVRGRAAAVTGQLEYSWEIGARASTLHYLRCDGRRFTLRSPPPTFNADIPYRVHYAPHTGDLLSLEPA